MSFSKACLVCLGGCSLPIAAMAQESASEPLGEVGVHYAYNSLTTSASGESIQSGGSIYGEYFFKKAGRSRLGIVADFSGSGSNSGSLYTYLAGPRFNVEWRKSHLVGYGKYKIGGAHVGVNGATPAGLEASVTRNSFVWGFAGTGLDLLLAQHYVVTLFKADFLNIEVPDVVSGSSHWRADIRISAGVWFRFGQK